MTAVFSTAQRVHPVVRVPYVQSSHPGPVLTRATTGRRPRTWRLQWSATGARGQLLREQINAFLDRGTFQWTRPGTAEQFTVQLVSTATANLNTAGHTQVECTIEQVTIADSA